MILNLKGPAISIVGSASSVPYDVGGTGSRLVSVFNAGTNPAHVTETNTGFGVYIGAGERVSIAKSYTETLLGENGVTGEIWATPIGYEN
tara:strand:+ start:368 stop:637 length:270 start_codon:yes stop_codon:yes gene_type:complete